MVVHLVLNDDGSWSMDDRELAWVKQWEEATGGKLLPGGDGGKKSVWDTVPAGPIKTEEEEPMNVLPEQPRAVVKKDMSAGRERGATPRGRAEALLNDLGLPRTKPNVALVVETMEALIADYEQMIIDLNNSSETARDKAGAWDRLVNMILTKGQ